MADDISAAHDPPVLDLTTCDREPIHIPGVIQPHGILFGLSADDCRVTAVSANAGAVFGRPAQELLDAALPDLLDAPSFAAIAAAENLAAGESVRLARLRFAHDPEAAWRATVHPGAGGLLLEAEPSPPGADVTAIENFERFQAAARRLQAAHDVPATCARLVREVRRLTGHARVMLYRFAPDWSGEVIAEDADGAMTSFMGLRFPASDIPAQARALYASNLERQIPDVAYAAVPILLNRAEPLDLSAAGLRGVSPMHLAYLRNMAAGASMSISLMHRGRLWGLVACHHPTPLHVPVELRQSIVLLVQLAAARLGLIEEAQIARGGVAVKAIETHLLRDTTNGRDYRDALAASGRALLDLLHATGLVIRYDGTVTTVGATPTGAALDDLLAWLIDRGPASFATDHLAGAFPHAAALGGVAGILAVPLGGVPGNLLVWCRPEVAQTVRWAGNPVKPVETMTGDNRLTPRHSFEAWVEHVRGRSPPWTQAEITAALGLRDVIVEIIARRAIDLERLQVQLKRTVELEAFAYVASHDLKEPLRQIEMFGTLLERAFARKSEPAEKIARWFAGIRTSSQRLRTLISDLAEFSRVGGEARPFEPADLNRLVQAVLDDLEGRIEETAATIEVSPLPVLVCDAVQIRQVLQNLIANALKYRHPDRAPVITISAETTPAPLNSRALEPPRITLRIADNGIGFEDRHRERIFDPFERLHSADEIEGSGLGLAICRKVVSRHGGTITASGRPGEGATFIVTLPLRRLPEPKVPPP